MFGDCSGIHRGFVGDSSAIDRRFVGDLSRIGRLLYFTGSLQAGEVMGGSFNSGTDIMYRSFVKYEVSCSQGSSEDFKSGRVATGVKGIRFANVEEKDEFLE